jgi:putative hydrolase of the HAD superfamily
VAIRAVLFDVGGPLDTEVLHEQLVDRDIAAAFAAEGQTVTADDLRAASDAAVASYAPDAYAAMIWTLSKHDPRLAERVMGRFRAPGASERRAAERGGFEPREGMDGLLRRLYRAGLRLGLAANQPARIIGELDRFGMGQYFSHREVTGHHGYRKPDVRLFLRACEDLRVEPGECIMVGDRIDNDVVPAKLLGMATVLIRTGRHANQQARALDELPDVQVSSVEGLENAIGRLLRLSAADDG